MGRAVSDPCQSASLETVYINCTRTIDFGEKAPLWIALPMYGYVTPALTLVTLITNTFVVLVLRHKHLQSPTNAILLAMAVTELLTGLSSLPWSLHFYTFAGYEEAANHGAPEFWCKYSHVIGEVIPTACHTCAVWLTVYLAFQRYVHVVRGAKRQRSVVTTLGMTRAMICVICCAALASQLPHVLSRYSNSHRVDFTIGNQTGSFRFCVSNYAPWVEYLGKGNFLNIYYWCLASLVHLAPCFCLFAFTALLIRFMRIAERRRKKTLFRCGKPLLLRPSLGSAGQSAEDTFVTPVGADSPRQSARAAQCRNKRAGFYSTTRMLLVLILIFLLIEVPAAVIYTLHVLLLNFRFLKAATADQAYRVFNVVFVLRNVSILVSYPVNFAVYCGMSAQFRRTVRDILLRARIGAKFGRVPEAPTSAVLRDVCDYVTAPVVRLARSD